MTHAEQRLAVGTGYVLAVGAANMDITGSTTHAPTPGDSCPGQVHCAAGGVARNVAENLARLGLDVRLLSALGDDLYGRSLLEHTRNAGVDMRWCRVWPGLPTSTYMSLHGADGDAVAAVSDMTILEHITPDHLSQHPDLLWGATALLVDCNLAPAALGWLFARAGDVPVYIDSVSIAKCRQVLPWLGQIHTLKANRLEAQALWGQPLHHDADTQAAARWLHTQGVRNVVLSLGGRGAYWSDGRQSGWQAALPVPVVNATGAGDALIAGLVCASLRGAGLPEAVQFAIGCAALTLTAAHANHPGLSVAAVEQLIDSFE